MEIINMENKLGKVNKRTFKTGAKKLKNIKMFEELGEELNEGKQQTAGDLVEQIWNDANFLYYLIDEGYIDKNLKPVKGMTDQEINKALKADFGSEFKDHQFSGSEAGRIVSTAAKLKALL